jgi:hypothetical protein
MVRRLPGGGPEWDELFERFRHSIFRFETLQHYDVPVEREPLRRFLSGEAKPYPLYPRRRWWEGMNREAKAAGQKVERVRVLVEPLTDYDRYEVSWPYFDNVRAGEDIRIIAVGEGDWPAGLPGYGYDFYLFDSEQLALMHYDHRGRFLAVDLLDDPQAVELATGWRDRAHKAAVPYWDYLSIHRELVPTLASEHEEALGR